MDCPSGDVLHSPRTPDWHILWMRCPSLPPLSFMLGLSTQSPFARPPSTPSAEAVQRALEMAGTVSGGYAGPPCAFVLLGPEAEHVLTPLRPVGATVGTWVLVMAADTLEDGHRAHLQERTLTAAQRFMLALACDDIDSQWVEATPEAEAFAQAGLALGGHRPVGAIWCSG